MESVKSFKDYLLVEKQISAFYNDELNPKFWTKKVSKDGKKEKWVLDPIIRKKLLKIAEEFYEKFNDTIGKKPIVDIQLTGSLANYNYTDLITKLKTLNSPYKRKGLFFKKTTYLGLFLAIVNFQNNLNTPKFNVP